VVGANALRWAVFLDRDGVINRPVIRDGKPYPPDCAAELEILPGVAESLRRLRAAGFLNIVVTNQPDVATGNQQRSVVEAMHLRLQQELAVDAIMVCYHADSDNCACRKPKPGMLIDASADHGIDLTESYVIGDRWRDVEAGQAAGCRAPFFIDYGYLEKRPVKPYFPVTSLFEAVTLILENIPPIHKS
jgi:D-glycero-D-manno-heptose 1,7-bisphosphate phosphatase